MFLFQIRCLEVFKGFYETRTKHRKLTWIYSLGTCHVTGKFDTKNIELIVPTYPVTCLSPITYVEICATMVFKIYDLVLLV